MFSSQSEINFEKGQSVTEHYKAFANLMHDLAQKYSDNVFFRYYALIEGKHGFKTLTYADVDRISTNLTCEWSEYAKGAISLIADHSVNYGIAMIVLLKLCVTVLCMSPRNSEAADINILEKTNNRLVIASEKYRRHHSP